MIHTYQQAQDYNTLLDIKESIEESTDLKDKLTSSIGCQE